MESGKVLLLLLVLLGMAAAGGRQNDDGWEPQAPLRAASHDNRDLCDAIPSPPPSSQPDAGLPSYEEAVAEAAAAASKHSPEDEPSSTASSDKPARARKRDRLKALFKRSHKPPQNPDTPSSSSSSLAASSSTAAASASSLQAGARAADSAAAASSSKRDKDKRSKSKAKEPSTTTTSSTLSAQQQATEQTSTEHKLAQRRAQLAELERELEDLKATHTGPRDELRWELARERGSHATRKKNMEGLMGAMIVAGLLQLAGSAYYNSNRNDEARVVSTMLFVLGEVALVALAAFLAMLACLANCMRNFRPCPNRSPPPPPSSGEEVAFVTLAVISALAAIVFPFYFWTHRVHHEAAGIDNAWLLDPSQRNGLDL